MSVEHDSIGLSAEPAFPNSMENLGLNLKATELRLGLPGSESTERGSTENNNNNNNTVKSFVDSGGRRVFSKWVFSGSDPALYCPRTAASNGSKLHAASSSPLAASVEKETAAAQSPNPVVVPHDKKPPGIASSSKGQVVGWPPIRSFRKNTMSSHSPENEENSEAELGIGCLYVKVSMDGAPYLRKVDLKTYGSYMELSSALEKMFCCFTIGHCGSHKIPSRDRLSQNRLMDLLHGSEYVLTYEDKDGDWMLVGDVPWGMFTKSCKRLRIMKSSEAIGLAPRAMEKCKNCN